VEWVIILTIIIAAFSFFRSSFKRHLKDKVQQTGDYLLWTRWGSPYNPDGSITAKKNMQAKERQSASSSKSKTDSSQRNYNVNKEKRGQIDNEVDFQSDENSMSTSVEDGASPVLKTFDLD